MSHADLKQAALDAIDALFSDTSVSPEQTVASLEEVVGDAKMKINLVREDLGLEGGE